MDHHQPSVRAVTVANLLDQSNPPLTVPPYQRPYSWDVGTAIQLLDDVTRASGAEEYSYVLGAVILHAHEADHGPVLDVVDGQQRLITLTLLAQLLNERAADSSPATPAAADNPITRVRLALGDRVAQLSPNEAAELRDFLRDRCEVIEVITHDQDEAFRIFDSQNHRGKALEPHDLLKAYHLRQMNAASEREKIAVVEQWESRSSSELSWLFSTFLYRIAQWTQGEPAPRFTAKDIGLFKGITINSGMSPYQRYHAAAQASLPLLSTFEELRPEQRRDRGHARFQFDMPLVAGRPFFEMTEFMLTEVLNLVRELHESDDVEAAPKPLASFYYYTVDRAEPGPSAGKVRTLPGLIRYRYVTELYLAAMLYCTNRFGVEATRKSAPTLVRWAFSPRVRLQRVQQRTIDNLGAGRDEPSPFRLLRDATDLLPLAGLGHPVTPPTLDHERELIAALGWEEHR